MEVNSNSFSWAWVKWVPTKADFHQAMASPFFLGVSKTFARMSRQHRCTVNFKKKQRALQFDVPSGVLISSKFQKQVSRFTSSMKLIHMTNKIQKFLILKSTHCFIRSDSHFSSHQKTPYHYPQKKQKTHKKKANPIQPTKKILLEKKTLQKKGRFFSNPPGFYLEKTTQKKTKNTYPGAEIQKIATPP